MARWSKGELERRKLVETGQSVVSNIKVDLNLIAWARAQGIYVYIGRPGRWGNPYPIREGCTREQCLAKYRLYFAKKIELQGKLELLQGKVLGCFCHPEPCHGHELLKHLQEHTLEHHAH